MLLALSTRCPMYRSDAEDNLHTFRLDLAAAESPILREDFLLFVQLPIAMVDLIARGGWTTPR